MRILVTGGAGFIGTNLCRELLSRHTVDRISILDDFSTGKVENLSKLPVEIIKDTILNRGGVRQLVREHDAVVHLAAQPSVPASIQQPSHSHEVNTNGTINVLDACREFGTSFVFASSSAVYGPADRLPIDEGMAARPQTPYAANKLAAESYALAYAASYNFPVAAFRFFNVYGPFQSPDHAYAAVVPSFVDAALRNAPLTVHGDGSQTRDFTFVGSVAGILADAAEEKLNCLSPINLAFGTRTRIIDLARKIEEIVGRPLDVRLAPTRAGDIRDSQASCDLLQKMLPRRLECSLDSGLRETILWFNSLQLVG